MTDRDALLLLFLMLAGDGRGWHAVELSYEGRREFAWLPARGRVPARGRTGGQRFVESLERWVWEREPLLRAVPLLDHGAFWPVGRGSVLWARCESRDSERRLARFRPEPTLVIREGGSCRRTALWAIRRPLGPEDLERANLRLSFALGTKRSTAGVNFRFHPPGTVLRFGRSRPVPVVVDGGSGEEYPAGRVVRRLRDAPDPDAWRRAA